MPLKNAAIATYCPLCRKAGIDGESLCENCGETLFEQGFCHVCDSHWLMQAGELCPKHDIDLETPPIPKASELDEGEFTDWVFVAGYSNTLAAEAPRIRLEAEGIPTFLEGSRMGEHGMYQIATGGVRLQVPRDLAADARIVLSQTWAPPETDDDLDDAWEDLAPEPGSMRRSVMRAAIVLILAFPLFRVILMFVGGR